MDFAVPAQIADDGEMASAAFNFTGKCCRVLVSLRVCSDGRERTLFTSVTVHVRLQRTRSGKSLVANFALVFFLRARRDFG